MTDGAFLCHRNDIPEGRSRGVLPNARGRDQVLLVRKGSDIFAYINNCPHYDRAPLGWKKNEFLSGDGQHIMCAAHGALFRIDDGLCEIGPCLGQSLTPIKIIEREGGIYLHPEGDTKGLKLIS